MDNKPLLSTEDVHPVLHVNNNGPTVFLIVSLLKWTLKTIMWVVFIGWITVMFMFPSNYMKSFYMQWIQYFSRTPFGITGAVFMIFSAPILIIAFLAIFHLIISGEDEFQKKKTLARPRYRLWTFPVLVDGPFGVVSAAELIGILVFGLFIIWSASVYMLQDLKTVSDYHLPPFEECYKMLEKSGLHFGAIGLFCLAFLFLPIARGSVLLRLIDIPFEHATRYHVWLGHLTMFIFTLHGLFYILAWAMQRRLLEEVFEWKDIGVANLAGVVSLFSGLLMWVTSLSTVRKQYFELFFYTHQLYIVFVIFLVLHVGDFVFSICAGGIFLFMLDRFLRFFQSRRTVKIISATSLPCGTIELVISKPRNLRYNALSFVFVQIRELSFLQWHPFSVSSSPMDGKCHIAILIKVLGEWTENLRGHIHNISEEQPLKQPYSDITAAVEGPYGHESPYHLMYENLVLVAGGIGISPFLAILSDILHRIKEGKHCLPKNILLVWAIKTSDELSLLSAIDLDSVYPVSPNKLNFEISTYVTRESECPLEEGKICGAVSASCVFPASKGSGMSVLVGTGNNIWSGIYIISSTLGFVFLARLLYIYYINPYKVTAWWYKGLLFGTLMVASIFTFGGLVVGLWHIWEKRMASNDLFADEAEKTVATAEGNLSLENLADSNTVHYGCRPDFEEIFGNVSENWGHVDVGVIVCGPSTLQASVAKECRARNFKGTSKEPIFHFNSHSFDL